jgi:histidinol-phosphate aminotransferase
MAKQRGAVFPPLGVTGSDARLVGHLQLRGSFRIERNSLFSSPCDEPPQPVVQRSYVQYTELSVRVKPLSRSGLAADPLQFEAPYGIFPSAHTVSWMFMPLVPPYIEALEPYKPGKPAAELERELGLTNIVKLASNENPLGPSPRSLAAMEREFPHLHLYPNGGLELRQVLAEKFNLRLENVIAGSGSEGIMSSIIRAFLCDDDEVLTSEGTFVGFYVLARSRGVRMVTVPLEDYRFDLPSIATRISEKTKIIYLANPNNPTGTIVTTREFDVFMDSVPAHVLIILDEAYFEYAKENPLYPDSMHYRYDNVITLRTFSKIYGLAGVRIGYGFAHDLLINNLLKVKLPFEPSTLAQAAGIAALEDSEFLYRSLMVNASGKRMLTAGLGALGYPVVPTEANFLLLPLPTEDHARNLYQGLLQHGVIVRPLRTFGLPHCLRITIGTQEQNTRLMHAMSRLKGEASPMSIET